MRHNSIKAQTREWAKFSTLFIEDRQPTSDYLLIPKVSSGERDYIPMGFCSVDTITNPSVLVIPGATIYQFGILQSTMHMAWMRATAGRFGTGYQYSNTIVYNNFPWPFALSISTLKPEQELEAKQRQAIEIAAQGVLDARALYPKSSLAALYDPLFSPVELVKAHRKLDAVVDAAYSKQKFTGDVDRVAFLFTLYQQIASPLDRETTPKRSKRPKPKDEPSSKSQKSRI